MILTKILTPRVTKSILHRSRFFDSLNEAMNRKLTLISAPAGFGKTSLIIDWVEQRSLQAHWLSLDKNDTDPIQFLSYLIKSIQQVYPKFGCHVFELVKSPNRPSIEAISGLLVNDMLEIDQNCLIIFDDFHLADSYEISEVVSYLLERIPSNFHLLISTRSDPMLPSGRLRSQNQLLELRSSDIAFTSDDIFTLFNKKLKIDLSRQDACILETKTEGWIAGLQLAALSLQNDKDTSQFIQEFSGNNRYIMDYLIEEVLKSQSDDLKEFLLQTSILERFSSPLCNTLLGRENSQETIEQLEKSNLFIVPLDSERKWYRYQHLFADLLKQRLSLKDKEFVDGLHQKSIEWYEKHEIYDLAFKHSFFIKDYERSIQLLEQVIEQLWKDGFHSLILNYGKQIPANLLENYPLFCLYYAWVLYHAGESQNALSLLDRAYSTTANHPEMSGYRALSGKIAVAKAHLNANEIEPEEIVKYYTLALDHLSEKEVIWLGWAWKLKGMTEIARGNIRIGIDALIKTVEYGKKSNNLYLISSVALTLAYHESISGQHKESYQRCVDLLNFMKEKGFSDLAKSEWMYSGMFTMMSVRECVLTDFDKALENVKVAEALSKNGKDLTQKIIALLAYSYILYAIGDKSSSESKLFELEKLMEQFSISPYINTTYVGWKLYLLVDSNRLEQARDFAEICGISVDGEISFQNESSYLNFTRLIIARGEFDQAESILSKLFQSASTGERVETLVQIEILFAVINLKRHCEDQAIRHLISAMEYAVKEELFIYFLFDLDVTTNILKKAYRFQSTSKTNVPKSFIKKLENAIKKKENRIKLNANFNLSDRELDTLKFINQNFSNKQIAEKLYVSVNTIKTHIKNIYIKLGVNSRMKALETARDLKIIN